MIYLQRVLIHSSPHSAQHVWNLSGKPSPPRDLNYLEIACSAINIFLQSYIWFVFIEIFVWLSRRGKLLYLLIKEHYRLLEKQWTTRAHSTTLPRWRVCHTNNLWGGVNWNGSEEYLNTSTVPTSDSNGNGGILNINITCLLSNLSLFTPIHSVIRKTINQTFFINQIQHVYLIIWITKKNW